MVPTDDGEHIPAIFRDFVEVFNRTKAEILPLHRSTDHAFDLEPMYNLPYVRIYNLSEFELRMLKSFIEEHLANRFIQRSSLPAAASILLQKRRMED